MIAHARPSLDDGDAERVARTIRSGFVAHGREVEAFETELAALQALIERSRRGDVVAVMAHVERTPDDAGS